MKIKTLMFSMLALTALVGCSEEDNDLNGSNPDGVAYVSINIQTQEKTRASSEGSAETDESAIKSLYLVTFDDNGKVLPVPGTTNYFSKSTAEKEPDAFRVSASAAKLLVVANPGTKLLEALNNLTSISYFSTLNGVITDARFTEIAGDQGFTMINVGLEPKNPQPNDKISDALIDIKEFIQKVDDTTSEEDAKQNAEKNRVKIKIERLASKVAFKLKNPVETKGAFFEFQKWTIDVVNTEFFPFAEKAILTVIHSGTSYTYNFYTKDPNFGETLGAGLDKASIDAEYNPVLPIPYTWMNEKDDNDEYTKVYAIENTMDASNQLYGNATRLIVKGIYCPKGFTENEDWFSIAGTNYKNLADLQAAYSNAELSSGLKTACDNFYEKISDYLEIDLVGGFADLKQEDHLNKVANGGEVVKDDAGIRWYQKGLCYYYNEIRHDNASKENMSFGKYGIVRNNWYSLTLANVNGPGTPWYPDPTPTDPIDEETGYLGVEIIVSPWIFWDNEIDF